MKNITGVRIRPFSQHDLNKVSSNVSIRDKNITIHKKSQNESIERKFDFAYNEYTSTENIYSEMCSPIIEIIFSLELATTSSFIACSESILYFFKNLLLKYFILHFFRWSNWIRKILHDRNKILL